MDAGLPGVHRIHLRATRRRCSEIGDHPRANDTEATSGTAATAPSVLTAYAAFQAGAPLTVDIVAPYGARETVRRADLTTAALAAVFRASGAILAGVRLARSVAARFRRARAFAEAVAVREMCGNRGIAHTEGVRVPGIAGGNVTDRGLVGAAGVARAARKGVAYDEQRHD